MREEGKVVGGPGKPPQQTPRPRGSAPTPIIPPSQPRSLPNYNRYDQEQFHGKNHTHGFNIETTGTFSGMKNSIGFFNFYHLEKTAGFVFGVYVF